MIDSELEIAEHRWSGWKAIAVIVALASPWLLFIFSLGFALGRWGGGW